MEREHQIRLLGPYGPEHSPRPDAERMAQIQTEAWEGWLAAKGVSREVIESTLWSDVQNDMQMNTRSLRLGEAFQHTDDTAVLYSGAFATSGEMVGFSKFMLWEENDQLIILLAEIDVLPDYQGKNAPDAADHDFAKKMIYSIVANTQNPNTVIRLQVLASNSRARALYERLGFLVTDTSGSFDFEDADERIVHREPHWDMEASAVTVRDNLRRELGL